ncbi:MAG TPA: winged helix-turn-helix domain-containing protein [Stellaceae bacterium]|nr:winged helix-turn-helix domain-containing protein [Stellaceae bacterium]
MAKLTLRVDFGPGQAVGPGKIRLLEAIRDGGSISRGGRTLGMSYRRAWMLIDNLNRMFRRKVVTAQPGGERGGGAHVTPFGLALIARYRAIEQRSHKAAARELAALRRALRR